MKTFISRIVSWGKNPDEFVFFDDAGAKYPVELYKPGINWKLKLTTNRITEFYSAKELQTWSFSPFFLTCHDFSKKSYSIFFSCSITTKFFFNHFA